MFNPHKNTSCQGVKPNEDYAFSCEQFIFVADGGTGLSDKNYTNCASDAQWFTQSLGVLLKERLCDMSKTIGDVVSEIIGQLNIEYKKFLCGEKCDILAMPSSGLSILRLNVGKIEFFQLGDCIAVLLTKDNEVKILRDNSLPNLDNSVIKNVANISREKNIPFSEAMKYSKNQLIYNRKKLNKPDGYWILDLSGIGIAHATENRFSVHDIKAAAVMSDGFVEIVELFKLYNYKTLMDKMENNSLDSLCDELFKAQDSDPSMDKYPRFKHRDDTSVAWCAVQSDL